MKPKFYSATRNRPEETDGLNVPYAPAKRKVPQWRWYLILVVVASPLLYFAARGLYGVAVIAAPGNILLEQHELRAAVAGFVERMTYEIGDLVEAGTPILELKDPGLEERQLRLERELSTLKRDIPQNFPKIMQVLKTQVSIAERIVRDRSNAHRAMQELFSAGAATRAEVQLASSRLAEAESNLQSTKLDLAHELKRARALDDVDYDNAVIRIETELDLVDFRRSQMSHRSSYDGRVIDVYVTEGEFVSEGTPLLLVGQLDKPEVIAYLEPKHAQSVKEGGTATVRFPDRTILKARVVRDPILTKRMPAELVSTFGQRPMAVMLNLNPEHGIPRDKLIHGLPITVRFHYPWENRFTATLNRWFGRTAHTASAAIN